MQIQMEVFSLGDVELLLPLLVHEFSGLLCLIVEPVSDIGAGCCNDRLDLGQVPTFLN